MKRIVLDFSGLSFADSDDSREEQSLSAKGIAKIHVEVPGDAALDKEAVIMQRVAIAVDYADPDLAVNVEAWVRGVLVDEFREESIGYFGEPLENHVMRLFEMAYDSEVGVAIMDIEPDGDTPPDVRVKVYVRTIPLVEITMVVRLNQSSLKPIAQADFDAADNIVHDLKKFFGSRVNHKASGSRLEVGFKKEVQYYKHAREPKKSE